MKQRDCFFNRPCAGVPSHPWIILSDPDVDPDNVLIVNLTDAANHHDKSCILEPADHSEVITKDSCVNYMAAKLTSVAALALADTKGLLFKKRAMPTDAFQKIIAGAEDTDELKNAHRSVLRRQGIIR